MRLTFKQFEQIYSAVQLAESQEQLDEIWGKFFGGKDEAASQKEKDTIRRNIELVKKKKEAEIAKRKAHSAAADAAFKAAKDALDVPTGTKLSKIDAVKGSLDAKPIQQMRAGQLRAVDRNPFGESKRQSRKRPL
jgi:hypothetical protein